MHDCSLKPATAQKRPLQILFLKLLRNERMFSNFENLIENILFYRFKSTISDFNKNGIHAKSFLLVFSKVARERYILKPFNWVTGLLSRIHVSKKFTLLGKTTLLKVLEHFQKKFFSIDNFKRFELFNLSSFDVICSAQSTKNSYTENWHLRKCFLWVLLVSKNF